MGRMAELDISIKESFINKHEATCEKNGWNKHTHFENVVESIFNFGPIECAEDLIEFAKNVWAYSSCDILARMYHVTVRAYEEACLENGYEYFEC